MNNIVTIGSIWIGPNLLPIVVSEVTETCANTFLMHDPDDTAWEEIATISDEWEYLGHLYNEN